MLRFVHVASSFWRAQAAIPQSGMSRVTATSDDAMALKWPCAPSCCCVHVVTRQGGHTHTHDCRHILTRHRAILTLLSGSQLVCFAARQRLSTSWRPAVQAQAPCWSAGLLISTTRGPRTILLRPVLGEGFGLIEVMLHELANCVAYTVERWTGYSVRFCAGDNVHLSPANVAVHPEDPTAGSAIGVVQ
jgi:hypothetical protein